MKGSERENEMQQCDKEVLSLVLSRSSRLLKQQRHSEAQTLPFPRFFQQLLQEDP